MENKPNIISKIIVGGLGVVCGMCFASSADAYDNQMVHPALTEEVVKSYNINFSSRPISEEGAGWIRQGSIEEDSDVRPLHHFFDPVHNVGLAGVWEDAKNWAQDMVLQSQRSPEYSLAGFFKNPFSYATDYTWQRALYDYAKGNKERAFIALGHIVHLLEDMTVPDHTRDDAHLSVQDQASPYEVWTKRFNSNLGLAKKLARKNETPITLPTLDAYFEENANYSNKYFFSKDTINSSYFSSPAVTSYKKIGANFYATGKDEKGVDYKLFVVINNIPNIIDPYDLILSDYWNHLSKQAVLSGAGAINLFLSEAEKVKQNVQVLGSDKSGWEKFLGSISSAFSALFVNHDAGTPSSTPSPSGSLQTNQTIPEENDFSHTSSKESDFYKSNAIDSSPSVQALLLPSSAVISLPQISPFPIPSPSSTLLVIINTPRPSPSFSFGWGGPGIMGAPQESEDPEPGPSITPSPTPSMSVAPPLSPSPDPSNSPDPEENADHISPKIPAITTNDGNAFTTTHPIVLIEGTCSSDTDHLLVGGIEGFVTCSSAQTWQTNYSLTEGDNEFKITALDAEGNESDPARITVTKDTTAPDVELVLSDVDFGKYNFIISYQVITGARNDFSHIELQARQDQGEWQNITDQVSSTSTKESLRYQGMVGHEYVVRVRAEDLIGNASSWQEKKIYLTPHPVVVSEIAWSGTRASPADEWMELANVTDYPIDISGWHLYTRDGSPDITFVSGDGEDKMTRNSIIGPHGYYLLERKNGKDENDSVVSDIEADWWGSFGGGLNNSGEQIYLDDARGNRVDFVSNMKGSTANWFAGKNETHASMERVALEEDGDQIYNWLTFYGEGGARDAQGNAILGTPRLVNSANEKYHLWNGNIAQDTTLKASSGPYLIYDHVTVLEGATLTIEPGVIIKFLSTDGHQGLDVKGSLKVLGGEDNLVVFTSFYDDERGGDTNNDGLATEPIPGSWRWVHLFPQSQNNVIQYATFRYGGNYPMGGTNETALLNVDRSSAQITNSVFEFGLFKNVWAQGADVKIKDSIFRNTTTTVPKFASGASLYQVGGSVSVGGSIFENNLTAIFASSDDGRGTISLQGNKFLRNATPMYLGISADLGNDNIVENNLLNGFVVGQIPALPLVEWGGNVPLVIHDLTVPAATVLRIHAGTIIKFKSDDSWLGVSGILNIAGEDGLPVVFTSLKDDTLGGDTNNDEGATLPQAGDWASILIKNGSATSTLNYVQIRYGGQRMAYGEFGRSLLDVRNTPVGIAHSQFTDSLLQGVQIVGGAVSITDSSLSQMKNNLTRPEYGSHIGLVLSTQQSVTLHNDTFYSDEIGIFASGTPPASELPGVDLPSLTFSENDRDISPAQWIRVP